MKKHLFSVICILICLLFSGCNLSMDGEYLSVTPHQEQTPKPYTGLIEVSNYTQMRTALVDIVESGSDSGIMSLVSNNSATARHYVDSAIDYVMSSNPVASYAVDEINYEIGTSKGDVIISFDIDYHFGRAEILRIKHVDSMDEAKLLITNALDSVENSVILRVEQFKNVDLAQFVQNYANEHPDVIMEIPQVRIGIYPEEGADRVISLDFTYQTDRDDLQDMQEEVEAVFTSAELYVKKTAQVSEIYSRLYSFLMKRNEYTVQTSITPAYSLLHHGVGDSRAFANVYATMCRRAGLNCLVVSGTRDGRTWCWNIITFRGKYYHVDLLRCSENGEFQMQNPDEMYGYMWDRAVYPQE